MSTRRQALTCYGLALGLALTVALFGPDADGGMQILTMFTPTVAVLLMMWFSTDEDGRRSSWRELGLGHLGLRRWPAALGLPALVVGAAYAVTALVYPVSWQIEQGAAVHLLIKIVIISVLAVFEEVCWRGYLLPRLDAGNGPRAAAAVGLLHGIYHLPLIVLTTAYNPVGNRWIVIPLFLGLLTTAGVIYGWLREVSGSLWPVIVAHGTFNAVLGTAADSSSGRNENTLAYLTGETGLFTLLAAGIVAYALTRRRSARTDGIGRSRTDLITAGVAGALVLMVVGAGGGAVAAVKIGSRQIADDSIRSRDIRDATVRLRDLDPATTAALHGAAGAQGQHGIPGQPGDAGPQGNPGPQGAAGPPGAAGSDGVAGVFAMVGPVASITGNSGSYVFAGPPAQVTTTEARPRVTGSAAAPMGLNAGTPQLADVGMCFQPSVGGALTNLYGSNFSQHYFTTVRATYAVSATRVLPPGTYNVGMCVRNNGSSTINNNNFVNGWVLVTS